MVNYVERVDDLVVIRRVLLSVSTRPGSISWCRGSSGSTPAFTSTQRVGLTKQ